MKRRGFLQLVGGVLALGWPFGAKAKPFRVRGLNQHVVMLDTNGGFPPGKVTTVFSCGDKNLDTLLSQGLPRESISQVWGRHE